MPQGLSGRKGCAALLKGEQRRILVADLLKGCQRGVDQRTAELRGKHCRSCADQARIDMQLLNVGHKYRLQRTFLQFRQMDRNGVDE